MTNLTNAQSVIESMLAFQDDTKKTVMLFASPQVLIDKDHWKRFVRQLVQKKLLRLIAVDEIQLFIHYGLSFRSQFVMMSTIVFKKCMMVNVLQKFLSYL